MLCHVYYIHIQVMLYKPSLCVCVSVSVCGIITIKEKRDCEFEREQQKQGEAGKVWGEGKGGNNVIILWSQKDKNI